MKKIIATVVSQAPALIVFSFVALGILSLVAGAENTTEIIRTHLDQIVAVRDVRADPDQVSGVLVNLSPKLVHNVRVRIDRSWLWTDERHPGEATDSPGRTAVYTVPGEIPPGGHLPFTYRSDTPLPQRSDGRFHTSAEISSLDQVN